MQIQESSEPHAARTEPAAEPMPGSAGSRRRCNPLALVRLLRPGDAFMALGGTWVGAQLAGLGPAAVGPIIKLGLSSGLLSAASMAFNDWHDIAEDRLNRPAAPLVSGAVRRDQALAAALLLFALATALAAAVSPRFGVMAGGVIAMSVTYTLRLKGVPYVGNGVVAVLSSYPLWCWIILTGAGSTYLMLCIACVILCLGREVLRTAEDVDGDAACGIQTVATTCGLLAANRIGATLVCGSLALTAVAATVATINGLYVAMLAISATMASVLWVAAVRATEVTVRRLSRRQVMSARLITVLMGLACGFGVFPR